MVVTVSHQALQAALSLGLAVVVEPLGNLVRLQTQAHKDLAELVVAVMVVLLTQAQELAVL
jgi:hypothetical protein